MRGWKRMRIVDVTWLLAAGCGLAFIFGVLQPPVNAQTTQANTSAQTNTTTRTISKRTYTRTINSAGETVNTTHPSSGTSQPYSPPTTSYSSPPRTTTTTRTYTRTIPSQTSAETARSYTSMTPSSVTPATRRYSNTTQVKPEGYMQPPSKAPKVAMPVKSEPKLKAVEPKTVPATMQSKLEREVPPVSQDAKPQNPMPRPTPAGEVPDHPIVNQILWSTIFNIEASYAMQDYEILWHTISPRLQSEMDKQTLKTGLAGLHKQGLPLKQTLGRIPVFELEPHLIKDGRLRLRGYFDLAPRNVRFDLLYAHHNGLWRLDAIAFAPGD